MAAGVKTSSSPITCRDRDKLEAEMITKKQHEDESEILSTKNHVSVTTGMAFLYQACK